MLSDAEKPNQHIYLVLNAIPIGRVATYSQIARLCGMPNGARQVARALRLLPKETAIPWFRVINAQGKSSIPGSGSNRQIQRLEDEGVVFLNGRVDLKRYQWQP